MGYKVNNLNPLIDWKDLKTNPSSVCLEVTSKKIPKVHSPSAMGPGIKLCIKKRKYYFKELASC